MKFVRLGDICKVRNGYAFKSESFTEHGVPLIRISDIKDNFVNPENSAKTNYETAFENYKIVKGDILIAMSGATTGKFGIYNSDETAYQNQRVGCFKIIDKKVIDQTYLLHTLKIVKPIIEKKANGGAQPNISASNIEEIIIPLPLITDQIRIAEILSQAEALIAARKESIMLLDELLKSTFLEMFGTPTKPKFITETIENLSIKITDGTHQSPTFLTEGVPFLLVSNIINNEINYNTKKFISEKEYLELNKRTPIEVGDILITSVGSYGNPALVKTITKFAFQRHIAYIKPNHDKIDNVFLFGALKSDFVKVQIDRAVKGVAQLTLNLSELKKIQIPIPTKEHQNKYSTIAEKVESLKVKYQNSVEELQNMYRVLSQKAFKGELNVK